jgi:hypothetical protein
MGAVKRAVRPFFGASRRPGCAFVEESVEFEWHSGLSWQVRQRSSKCLAEAILRKYGSAGLEPSDILEVSTASEDYETGKALSALNLMYEDPISGRVFSVENWFQSAKVFGKDGQEFGPYEELLTTKTPKRYLNTFLDRKTAAQYDDDHLFQRIQSEIDGAELVRFELGEKGFPLIPRSSFYDYLYAKALYQDRNSELAERLCGYRVFTDIMFNPGTGKKRKYNTQARSCAIFVSLTRRGLIDEALFDIDTFIDLVAYDETIVSDDLPSQEAQLEMRLDGS